jgi:hypothetical protein
LSLSIIPLAESEKNFEVAVCIFDIKKQATIVIGIVFFVSKMQPARGRNLF